MSHPPLFRSAASRRALVLASGTALLAVVAPGLAQAQSNVFPILPAAPAANGNLNGSARANVSAAPVASANKKLTVIRFTPPARRTVRVSKANAANAFPFVNRAAKALAAGNTAQALSLYRSGYETDPNNEYAAPGVGTSLIILGRFDEAAQTFRNFLALQPNNRKALRGLADALTYSKKYSEAAGVNNYILSRNARDYAALYQNAQIATYTGDYQLSETYFSRAAGIKKSDPEFWADWGESLSYRRNPRAVNAFNRALSLRANYPRATQGLANYYSYSGQQGQAVDYYRRALALKPNDRTALRGLADALTYNKQYGEAVQINNRILALDPRDYASLVQYAQIATYGGQYKLSDEYFNKASGIENSDPALWAAWGESLTYRDEPNPRAVSSFNRALALRPNYTRATRGLADYYSYTKDFPRAIELFTSVLRADPNDVRALVGLGDALSYSQKPVNDISSYQQAIGYYQRALALQPNDLDARLGLGRALVFTGRNDQGVTELRRVLAQSPDNIKALEVLVIAQDATAPAQALQTYQTLLERTTEPEKKAKILASIGDLQLGAQQLDDAANSYQQAVQLAPNDPDVNLGYAQLLGYRTDYDGAEPFIERVLTLQPNNLRALALQTQIAGIRASQAEANNQSDASQYRNRADQLVANLVRFKPDTAQEALALADAMRDAGDSAKALDYLNLATSLSKDSANPETALRIANATRDSATRDNGGYDRAIDLYNSLLIADPNNVAARVELARALYYAGELPRYAGTYPGGKTLPEAKMQLAQALQLAPDNSAAKLLQLDLLTAGGELAEAEQGARALLATGPNAGASITLGTVFSARGDFNNAIEQYQTALQTTPNDVNAQIGLARNLYYARRVDESIATYRRLIQASPNNPIPRLELAKVFLDRNRLEEAELLFNQVLQLQQRGVAALPSGVRGIGGHGALARLSPQSIKDSFVKADSFAKLPAALGKLANKANPTEPRVVSLDESQVLKVVTVALAQVKPKTRVTQAKPKTPVAQSKPKTRVAQSASPTVGIGGELGSAAPPAASFPSGPIAPVEGAPVEGAGADNTGMLDDGSFVETAPLPPIGGVRDRQVVPRVPSDAGETNIFATPLTPGTAINSGPQDRAKAYVGLGEIRLRQSRYAEALEVFQQAAQADPNNSDAHLGIARVLRAQNDYAAALTEVETAISIEANNPAADPALPPDNLKARVLRAQLLNDTGQPQQSQAELDGLLNNLSGTPPLETYLTISQALNSLRNYDKSLEVLQTASRLYPNDPVPVRLSAETLNLAGRQDQSLELYDQIIAVEPNNGDAIVGKARVYNYSNRLPEAETTYRQALTAQPSNYDAQIELADVLARRGNYPDAIQLYALAIQSNPADLTSRVELARVQRYANRLPDAEATLTQILNADSRNVAALTERGILRGAQGSYAPAIADLQTALQIAPNSKTALLGLAEVQGYAGQYGESIAGYRAVLVTDPTNEKARTELGQVLSYSGDNTAGLREVDAVLATNPTSIPALLAKADILGSGSRTVEAVRIYNGVLTADPRNVRARSGLADTYVTGRRYADAIKIYDQLIEAEPNNSNYRIARARALGYNRQFVPASDALRQIIAAEPDNLTARLAYAEVGTNSGNRGLRNGAIDEYRRLIAAYPTNVPARVGLARALSYSGQTREAESTLKTVLAAKPNNVPARVALGETQRIGGKPFDARDTYKAALAVEPGNVSAEAGLAATRRATRPSVGVSYSTYNDTNGVRFNSVNFGGALRTRGGVIGVIAEQGRFEQRQFGTDRSNIGLSYAKAFGSSQVSAAISRLKYDGVSEKFLYDLSLVNSSVARRRYFLGTGRRDVYESAQAVAQGITATTYRGGFNVPVASKLDFELQGVYYRYSDDNSRYSILPALYYRFRPTNPSLRLGLGYTYDDSKEFRNIYYTPQGYSAFAALADYQNTLGKTRYGFNAAVPLTGSTGTGGVNRPADTLFGFISRDVGNSLELFANGGIVRSPDFKSDQVTFGGNLWF